MNVEIGTYATQFPEKEYINGIFLVVDPHLSLVSVDCRSLISIDFCFKQRKEALNYFDIFIF